MAHRACALIGPGKGPKVLAGRRKGTLRVSGKPAADMLTVMTFDGEKRSEILTYFSELRLPACDFVQVEYHGRSKGVIATLHLDS
jgi:hypothetical protein